MRSRAMRVAVFVGVPTIATALCGLESLRGPADLHITSAPVTSGDIVRKVVVTGVLQPVTTVDVSTQVSGTISEVDADFNSFVTSGQLLLRLDGSDRQAVLDEARATLTQARADLAAARVESDGASMTLSRNQKLAAQNLIAALDLDEARTAMVQANADVQGADARVADATAAVQQAELSLQQTVIRSPVDGVVISRNADTGATVAAVQSAPVLFRIATDFRNMQVIADVDESDVASIRVGSAASFEVAAYPQQTFEGRVEQVRLNAVRDQPGSDGAPTRPDAQAGGPAVVSYPVVIAVDNAGEKLRPGMTAVVTFEGARRIGTTRIPNAALSFVPSSKLIAATGQKPPMPLAPSPGSVANAANSRVWTYDGTEFTPVVIRTGLADDQWTELISGPLQSGAALVTNASTGENSTSH